MAMFPVFILGLIVGILVAYTWGIYKKETPSDAKLRIQEAEITRYKSDLEMYHNLADKLYAEIDTLKKKLNEK